MHRQYANRIAVLTGTLIILLAALFALLQNP